MELQNRWSITKQCIKTHFGKNESYEIDRLQWYGLLLQKTYCDMQQITITPNNVPPANISWNNAKIIKIKRIKRYRKVIWFILFVAFNSFNFIFDLVRDLIPKLNPFLSLVKMFSKSLYCHALNLSATTAITFGTTFKTFDVLTIITFLIVINKSSYKSSSTSHLGQKTLIIVGQNCKYKNA